MLAIGEFAVGTVDPHANTKDSEQLVALIHQQIMTGIASIPVDKRKWEVESYYRIIQTKSQLTNTFGELSKFFLASVGDQVSRIQKAKGQKLTIDFLLQVSILRLGQSDLRIDFDVYDIKAKSALVIAKTIGLCNQTPEEVVHLVREAAKLLISEADDRAPMAQLVANMPAHETRVFVAPAGSPVAIDACTSFDPDFDRLSWTWEETSDESARSPAVTTAQAPTAVPRTTTNAPPRLPKTMIADADKVIPSGGTGSPRLTFTMPTVLARHFKLTVSEVLSPEKKSELTFVVEPMRGIRAVAGQSRVVSYEDGREFGVALDGKGSNAPAAARYEWRQIGGPTLPVRLESETGVVCKRGSLCCDVYCTFVPPAPGDYAFLLTVRTDYGASADRVRILVARRPQAYLSPVTVAPGQSISIPLNGGIDDLDPHPQYAWRLHPSSEEYPCGRPVEAAKSGTPRARETTKGLPRALEASKIDSFIDGVALERPSGQVRHDDSPTAAIDGASLRYPSRRSPEFSATQRGEYKVSVRVLARRTFEGSELLDHDCVSTTVTVRPKILHMGLAAEFFANPDAENEAFVQPMVTVEVAITRLAIFAPYLSGYIAGIGIGLAGPTAGHFDFDPTAGIGLGARINLLKPISISEWVGVFARHSTLPTGTSHAGVQASAGVAYDVGDALRVGPTLGATIYQTNTIYNYAAWGTVGAAYAF